MGLDLSSAVRRTTLSEQVATKIASMVSAGNWKRGEKLPSEPELCQAFAIGRSTLREALKSLAFLGIVEMRHGDGTYVAEGPSRLLDRIFAPGLVTSENVSDLCEARIAMECELVSLCAQRATAENLEALDNLVREMNEVAHQEGPRFLQLDLDFHLTIASCSKNQVLANLLRTIRDILQELIRKSQELPGSRELACTHHARILEALTQHNSRRARSAMRSHLSTFQRRYKILTKATDTDDPLSK